MGQYPIATLAHIGFFVFALVMFKRLPRGPATAFVVLAGSLFLPETTLLQVGGIPTIDKERVTYLAALLAILTYQGRAFWSAKPGWNLELLWVLMFFGNVGTLFMNPNAMVNEGALHDGLDGYWLLTKTVDDFLVFILPFIIGRTMFRDLADLRVLLYFIVGAGLIYTVLIFLEIIMSIPFRIWQLSHAIYGVPMRPQLRYGFMQPTVFMDNGLAVATFMAVAVIAASAFHRAGESVSWKGIRRARAITLFGLLGTFNVAGSIYGSSMLLAMALLRPSRIALLALVLGIFACFYPALRMADMFPDERIIAFAERYDAERAHSLEGRFAEEDHVLDHIGERLWFGWGSYDRTPGAASFGIGGEPGLDGWWTIYTGISGIVGLELVYLLCLIPVFVAWRRIKRVESHAKTVLLCGLMLCIPIRMIDLLINGWWNYLPVFLAGALWGSISCLKGPSPLIRRGRRLPRLRQRGAVDGQGFHQGVRR